jgi:hypothetical protein
MRTVSPSPDVLLVSAKRDYNLGDFAEIRNATLGIWETWIYVQNNSLVAWVAGNAVGRNDAATGYTCELVPASHTSARIAGYAQTTSHTTAGVPAAYYAWVKREGMAEVIAGAAGVTADRGIIMGVAAGVSVEVAAATNFCTGYATEAAAVGNLATCRVDCIG